MLFTHSLGNVHLI